MRRIKDLAEFITYRSIPEPNSGCLIWLGAVDDYGYGWMRGGHRPDRTHRLMWRSVRGEIPLGMCVLHHCDNPACCNPDHLYIGTKADNARDRVCRNREADHRGEKNGRAKITLEQADEIFNSVENQCVLAARYGITQGMVSRIKRGAAWRM
jgi:hypothetical protein